MLAQLSIVCLFSSFTFSPLPLPRGWCTFLVNPRRLKSKETRPLLLVIIVIIPVFTCLMSEANIQTYHTWVSPTSGTQTLLFRLVPLDDRRLENPFVAALCHAQVLFATIGCCPFERLIKRRYRPIRPGDPLDPCHFPSGSFPFHHQLERPLVPVPLYLYLLACVLVFLCICRLFSHSSPPICSFGFC
ncbi:hypothetical protein B0O80DRAFT_157363 [Mortierella sp. GBAus27b]|nr:hypothetical protein B0O80DRAFT_157363 [Mortierella sp. GBAus27b]